MLQPKLLKKVLEVLQKNHIDYMITGSLVSSMQGEPRASHDIDIVINITSSSIPALINAFPASQYYLSEKSILDAIQNKSMFNLLDTTEGDKIDFWMLSEDAYDQSRFSRKSEEMVFGMKMNISKPEDTILMKLRWAKMSGGSDKQFTDAKMVYEVQYKKLDLNYMEHWVKELQIENSWKQLKKKASPIQ